ncbi:hypothetical protein [Pleurocapsa sp. PCC 7319]|uniref:hypothetical protein n=1 Tax=Pleurocapsa sp. PCC 7319 TaxID=118161 RepID=UPI0003499269|nr:hypothetical protein [Pleurocapsa sp. PCC 7319]
MKNSNGYSISSFERNKYFYSKLLTVRDFELEQKYGIEKNHLINRLILGEGIVCGLEIELDQQTEPDVLSVTLTPGVALDRNGREIVVGKTISEPLEIKSSETQYIYIEYQEHDREPIADIANGTSEESGDRYNRVLESFHLFLSSEAPPELESKSDLTLESLESLDQLVREYYDRSLKTGSHNKYEHIPLAVVDITDNKPVLNEEETQKVRPILRSNPMLYDLLERVYDLTQQAIDLPQIDANSFTSSDESIKITPTEEPKGFDFTLASETERSHNKMFTGKRVLELTTEENLPPGTLQPVTVRIDELAEKEPFTVILAPQLPATIPPVFTPTLGEQDGDGLRFAFGSHPELPRSYVAYVPQPYNKTFEIHGCDRNLSELNLKQVEVVYWVMAGVKEPSLKDRILELLANNPEGMGIGLIGRELDVERSILQEELTQLMDNELIRRNNGTNGKYFLV